jgi:hypothetical protein
MEALNMPSRDIRRRFTKSDIAIMAWRSAEVTANMHDKTFRPHALPSTLEGQELGTMENVDQDAMLKRIEERLGGIVYKFTDERGEIDLRKLTGDEAVTYLQAIGVPVIKMG